MFELLVFTLLGLPPAAPAIASLAPNNALVTVSQVRFSIIGTDFRRNSEVRWNDSITLEPEYVNDALLIVTVPAQYRAQAGTYTVTVRGGGTSNEKPFTINNPRPTIDSIAPKTALTGSRQIQLRVFGRYFVDGTAIFKNTQRRGTNFVSSSEVSFPLLASELTNVGSWQISVRNPGPGGGVSGSLPFTVLASSTTVTATVNVTTRLAISSFYIGGATNPERVFAGKVVPLYATPSSGSVAPTHWRVSQYATMAGAAWQPITTASTRTFSTAGQQTLFFQYRYTTASQTVNSIPVSDVVIVRRPWVDPPPVIFGKMTADHRVLRCPLGTSGDVLTGVRAVQNDYFVVTAVGYYCAGNRLSTVGGDLQGSDYTRQCTNEVIKSINLEIGPPVPAYLLGAGGMVMRQSEGKIKYFNGWCAASTDVPGGKFDPLYVLPVSGTINRTSDPYKAAVTCPAGAFPIALDVYFENTAVVGMGTRCAKPD